MCLSFLAFQSIEVLKKFLKIHKTFKFFALSIFEWPLKTGFTVLQTFSYFYDAGMEDQGILFLVGWYVYILSTNCMYDNFLTSGPRSLMFHMCMHLGKNLLNIAYYRTLTLHLPLKIKK